MAGTMLRFSEASDEDYDEAFGEDYDEAVRLPFIGGRRYSSGSGTRGGSMKLPGGQSTQVQFSKPMVSKEEFDKALGMVQRDIGKNTETITTLDKKFSSSVKSLKGQVEQGSMFPLLLSFMQPKLASVTFAPGTTITAGAALPVSASAQTDGMMMPLLLMMMGGGGFMGTGGDSSGKGGGQDMMMMLLMVMAMSGKL